MKNSLLKKLYAVTVASLLFIAAAEAQVIYTDVKPGAKFSCSRFGCSHEYNLDLNNDGINDFTIAVYKSEATPGCGNNKDFRSEVYAIGLDLNQTSGYPLLSLNTIINDPRIYSDSVNLGWASITWFNNCSPKLGCTCVAIKNSRPSSDGYLGLGLVKGADTYYGWVRLSVSTSYKTVSFAVKDYAYNSIPNQPILAGQTFSAATSSGVLANPQFNNEKIIFSTAQLTIAPNPFSISATISFSLPQSEKVSICIFDVTGRLIKVLADAQMQVGTHQLLWNAKGENGNEVRAGIYFLKMQAGNYSMTRKLVLLR